jgi:hypothetical protein
MDTITIKFNTTKINNIDVENTVTGFVFNYNGKNQIVTVHHFLPIDKVYERETNNELDIEINSSWNEGLILKTDNVDLSKYKIFSKVHNNIPKLNSRLSMKTDGNRIEFEFIGYDMFPFNNIQLDVPILFIKARIITNIDNFAGYCGSPVFIKNKIIGIFSKIRTDSNIAYIIPIYVITKNLEKEDNSNIYTMNVKNIQKIGSWIVNKDNEVYHPTLKLNIPIATYFLIEGDLNFKSIIYFGKKKTSIDLLQTVTKKDLVSDSDVNIITRNVSEYKLNLRLLSFLKKANFDSNVLYDLVQTLMRQQKETWIKIFNNKISFV